MRCFLIIVLLAAPACCADDSSWGDLTMRLVYDGIAPQPARVADKIGEAFCGDLSLVDESLIVNTINKGIRNVVVYAYEGPGGRKLPAIHPEATAGPRTFELANVNCNYVPRIVVMKSGDALSIVNTDGIGYTAMLGFMANDAEHFSLPPKSRTSLQVLHAEPAPIPVGCAIYSWMKARLLVLDHRYAGISDGNGRLSIRNLPTGSRLALRIYHENATLPGLSVGQGTVSRRGVFELTLKPGINDLGTVRLSAERFGM